MTRFTDLVTSHYLVTSLPKGLATERLPAHGPLGLSRTEERFCSAKIWPIPETLHFYRGASRTFQDVPRGRGPSKKACLCRFAGVRNDKHYYATIY